MWGVVGVLLGSAVTGWFTLRATRSQQETQKVLHAMQERAERSREAIANAAVIRVALSDMTRHLRSAVQDLEAGRPIDPTLFQEQYGELDSALFQANVKAIGTGSLHNYMHVLFGGIAMQIRGFADGTAPPDLEYLRRHVAVMEQLQEEMAEGFNQLLRQRFDVPDLTIPLTWRTPPTT
ncbi:hypothetical protein ABZS98_11040 [Streptomyces avermitilis]|uniref:hypothetical protein n=1 Tax=Streptomyces avermitilis TaxID=33903 RepID=UPI0033BCC156